MNCPRCEGLLVNDHLYHHRESLYILAIWRCVNCGATFDPISIGNRYKTRASGRTQKRESRITWNLS